MSGLGRPEIAVAILLYALAVLGVGLWAWRRTKDATDFFVAGRRLGGVVAGLTTMSAAFSGFVFIGGPGLTTRLGVGAILIAVPVGFTATLLTVSLGPRLARYARRDGALTVPDVLAARYGSKRVGAFGALAIVAGCLGYLASQLLAMGVLLEAVLGPYLPEGVPALPLLLGLGVLVLVLYSAAGGMLAGVATDLLQGVVMLLTAAAVIVAAWHATGGLAAAGAAITHSELFGASFLEPLGRVPWHTGLGFLLVFGVGVLGQPHMLHKFLMLRDPKALRQMPLVIGASQSLCILLWLALGLAVPALVAAGRLAAPESPDQAAPLFLLSHAPPLVAGLAIAGVLAAIMSTADSFLNVAAAALVRDLPRAFGRGARDELRWGRIATALLAPAAALLAWAYGDLVALLGTFAFGTFAAALAPALAIGLHWRRVTARAAAASILTGLTLNLALDFLGRQTLWPALPGLPFATGVLPGVVSLAASVTVLVAVTLSERGGSSPRRLGPTPHAPRP